MPDSCFRLIKQCYRYTNVQCLDDIASVVENSASVNLVETVNRDILVPTYNWVLHYASCLKKSAPVCIRYSHPGSVVCKE